MKFMLDTNMCVYAQKRIPSVVKNMCVYTHVELVISAITLAELEYGIEKSEAQAKNLKSLHILLENIDVIPFESAAAHHYGEIRAYLCTNGTPIGTMDMLIAAHARSLGLTVVTNNVREFERVPGLKIENWIE